MSYPIVLPFSQNNPLTGVSSPPNGALLHTPQIDLGPAFAFAVYTFFLTGTSTPTPVYQNGSLTTQFSPSNQVTADGFGRFPAIYLDNTIAYKVVLTSSAISGGSRTTDPYNVALATTGTSSVEATGISVNQYGEYTIAAPAAGGSGVTLTLNATAANLGAALALVGNQPGTPLLIVNNSVTTGAQTATFTATNKPGTATSAPVGWLPIKCDGVIYYIPLWFDNNFARYSTGASGGSASAPVINAASFTLNGDGSVTLVGAGATAVPSQWFSPLQAGIGAGYWINITKTSGPAGAVFTPAAGTWTNIGSGGLSVSTNTSANVGATYQLSTSVTGSPVVASGSMLLGGGNGAQGPAYSGVTPLVLAGNGTATVGGVSAPNWYLPTTASIGSGFWINITQTGGAGSFTAASGVWTNISAGGLTIGVTGGAASGTYQLATNSSGTQLVSSGTISLVPAFGGQTDTYNTAGTFTDTIPTGAAQVVIETWGASGGGGGTTGSGGSFSFGGGGASGGYTKITLSLTSADWGKTLKVIIGAAGAAGGVGANGTAGGNTSVSTLTKVITTQAGGGGGPGAAGSSGGFGGSASGGSTNTNGNNGTAGTHTTNGVGGSGIAGTNGTGKNGGSGSGAGGAGAGLAILKYT